MKSWIRSEGGFSIVELMVALVILTVGLLSLAATTGYVSTQVRTGDLRTERAAALQQVIENLRATPFANLASVAEAQAITVGDFRFWWTVNRTGSYLAEVEIYSRAVRPLPGASGHGAVAPDTFSFSIVMP
ncbi:MAG TPA: prepilin-type N-terminal cleavage/methylation domain-containing protein [Longimicrobiales bacterium]